MPINSQVDWSTTEQKEDSAKRAAKRAYEKMDAARPKPTPTPAPPPIIQSPTKDMSLDWHPSRLKGSRMNGRQ